MEQDNPETADVQCQTAGPDINAKPVHVSLKISNLVFYVPFLYIYLVRCGAACKFVSLLFVLYLVPTFYFFSLHLGLGWSQIYLYLLAFLLIYGLYELGYLQNDTETVKNEVVPSLRLYEHNFKHYEQNKKLIYSVRILWCLALSILIVFANGFNTGSCLFLVSAWSIAFVYQLYNRIRNRWNLFYLVLLTLARYFSYIFLFINTVKMSHVIALFFAYSFLKIVESAVRRRYGINWLLALFGGKENFTVIRVRYYLVATLLSLILVLAGLFDFFDVLFFLWFFSYRLCVFAMLKIGLKFRNYLSS